MWTTVTPVKHERDIQYTSSTLAMVKNSKNNGTEKIGFATPSHVKQYYFRDLVRHFGSFALVRQGIFVVRTVPADGLAPAGWCSGPVHIHLTAT